MSHSARLRVCRVLHEALVLDPQEPQFCPGVLDAAVMMSPIPEVNAVLGNDDRIDTVGLGISDALAAVTLHLERIDHIHSISGTSEVLSRQEDDSCLSTP